MATNTSPNSSFIDSLFKVITVIEHVCLATALPLPTLPRDGLSSREKKIMRKSARYNWHGLKIEFAIFGITTEDYAVIGVGGVLVSMEDEPGSFSHKIR